jgi:hypothetical protein
MSGELLSSLVVILCIALLVGFFLLLGSITGIHPSQTGIMLIAPPYHLA